MERWIRRCSPRRHSNQTSSPSSEWSHTACSAPCSCVVRPLRRALSPPATPAVLLAARSPTVQVAIEPSAHGRLSLRADASPGSSLPAPMAAAAVLLVARSSAVRVAVGGSHAPPDVRHGAAAARSLQALHLQVRGEAAMLLLMRAMGQWLRAPSWPCFSMGCSWMRWIGEEERMCRLEEKEERRRLRGILGAGTGCDWG